MSLESLLKEVRACRVCEASLPLGPRPVLQAGESARLLIVGQAPGIRVHESGIPWNDPSGVRLRRWLDMEPAQFYDPNQVAIVPMGFCYPGSGAYGDLPPRPECAPLWMERLRNALPNIRLTLLLGTHSLGYYLGKSRKKTLTETVKYWEHYLAKGFIPLPHPSPRNNRWFKTNPWFEEQLVPVIQRETLSALAQE